MTCDHCTRAATDSLYGGYHADCRGCQVRSIARSPAFFIAHQANAMTGAYRATLRAFFAEDWQQAHEEIKAEYERHKSKRPA